VAGITFSIMTAGNVVRYGASIAVLGALGAFVAYAWNSPPANPPQGNAPHPLTVSPFTEEKVGISGIGNFPESYRGIIAVNDIFIQSLNRWVSSFSPGYATGAWENELRPDQGIVVKIVSSGSQFPEASCPVGYELIGCSGSRVVRSSQFIRNDQRFDYWGALQVGGLNNPRCRTEIAAAPFPDDNYRPIAYAYCAKSTYYD